MGNIVTIHTPKGDISAYEARPEGKIRGGLIVIHEVWGLDDHIKDVTHRFAREGYLALAPELLAGAMDTAAAGLLQEDFSNPEKRNATQPRLRALMAPIMNPEFGHDTLVRVQACFEELYSRPEVGEQVAIIGFCFGGTYSFGLAVKEPRLKLALPFYGHSNYSAAELSAIKCRVHAFYGERDENLMKALPDLKAKMAEAKVEFEATVYPDCGHAFFNDTNRFAYNQPAAVDAWAKALNGLERAFT